MRFFLLLLLLCAATAVSAKWHRPQHLRTPSPGTQSPVISTPSPTQSEAQYAYDAQIYYDKAAEDYLLSNESTSTEDQRSNALYNAQQDELVAKVYAKLAGE